MEKEYENSNHSDEHVRWATPNDAEAILALNQELIETSGVQFESKLNIDNIIENFFGSDPKAEVIVYECMGKVIGHLIFTRGYGPWQSISTMMINAISIKKTHKRKGIGKKLMIFAADIANTRGWKRIELYVDENYFSAKNFYHSLGFNFKNVSYAKCSSITLSSIGLGIKK